MSVTYPTPYYPDLQLLSATLATSGIVTVTTKFRQVTGALAQFVTTNTSTVDIAGNQLIASANRSQVAFGLYNASALVSSARVINVWATGIM